MEENLLPLLLLVHVSGDFPLVSDHFLGLLLLDADLFEQIPSFLFDLFDLDRGSF